MKVLEKVHGRTKRLGALAAAVALLGGLAGTAGIALSAVGTTAAAGAAGSPCQTATVSYVITVATTPILVKAVVVNHLGTACNGKTAKLVLEGNPTGSTTGPANKLSTADSTLTPCTGNKLTTPGKVSGGSITLDLCSTATSPTRGPYVSVHDLTHLTLTVGGVSTAPGAVVFTTGPTGHNGTGVSGGHTATTGALAFTGADIAAMVAAGLILLALGTLLVLWERRRHRSAGTEA